MRAGQDAGDPRRRVPAPPAPLPGWQGQDAPVSSLFYPNWSCYRRDPKAGRGAGGVPRLRGRSRAPGAAARTAAAPWRPPGARGPQRLPRGRRQPPGGSERPVRPLRSWGQGSSPRAREGAPPPPAGPPWPTPPLGPRGRAEGGSGASAAPSTLAARPQPGRRRRAGGAPRGAGDAPLLRGAAAEGPLLGVEMSGPATGGGAPGGFPGEPGSRGARGLGVGVGNGPCAPGRGPLSSAKMPAAPRGRTQGKFPPARKARVGAAPRAAPARGGGGGERSQRRFRGAGGGCGARATWARRWALARPARGPPQRMLSTFLPVAGCFGVAFRIRTLLCSPRSTPRRSAAALRKEAAAQTR